jgi:polyphosphate kinase
MTPRRPGEFLNRELSWLEFNSRVLEEAQDPRTPLLERFRFYCIFHSNLDEFFMVRVASLIRKVEEGDLKPDPSGLLPARQLELIRSRATGLVTQAGDLYHKELIPSLAKEGVGILDAGQISDVQQAYLDDYFEREVYPVLTPIAIDEARAFPRLAGLAVNLAVRIAPEKGEDLSEKLAVVQVPGKLPGLIRLPDGDGLGYCWLSDVIRTRLARLFKSYRIEEVGAFRLTRDSELELDDEGFDDYVHMLESELKQRRRARPVRVECERSMSPDLLKLLQQGLGVEDSALQPVCGPLDPRAILTIVDMAGYGRLRYPPQLPLLHPVFGQGRSIFELIQESDLLLHHPYDSFDPVEEFIERAAGDPDVLAIKQTLYRTSGLASPVVRALINAAETGKQVTVLVELKARFDEERNISWARYLEEAGAHVIYGVAGLKVHAKIALVVRREPDGIHRYVHLGTGNYNERTARIYTDLSLLTAAEEFGADASGFFNTITGYSEPPIFDRLAMAPNTMRQATLTLIRREIDRAQSGQSAGITAKINSLVDPDIIEELYRASRAGVPIRLNVRGICCLRPGVPGLSENIYVVSIVDRYLEHSRVFVYHNGGMPEVFASSADWMPRNLDRRIELMFPIVQEHCKRRVIADLEAQFLDNQQARVLKADGTYERISPGRSGGFRVQEGLYRRLSEEHEKSRGTTPVRFVPLESKAEQR